MYNKLKKYYNALSKAQEEAKEKEGSPHISRVDTPEGVTATLWIPTHSGNRTAAVNLNHKLIGFDDDGNLWGANGNCGTRYIIIPIPSGWPETFENEKLDTLSEIVCRKLNKPANYPKRRVLKADERLPVIIEAISEMTS